MHYLYSPIVHQTKACIENRSPYLNVTDVVDEQFPFTVLSKFELSELLSFAVPSVGTYEQVDFSTSHLKEVVGDSESNTERLKHSVVHKFNCQY